MNKNQILLTLVLAVGAIFLWKNYTPSSAGVAPVQAAAPVSQSTKINPVPPRAVTAPAPQAVSTPRGSNTVVIAPTPKGGLADRFKTGPTAQNNWVASGGQLKSGPNAQTDLNAKRSQLKTGPNAQTDLTMKRSW